MRSIPRALVSSVLLSLAVGQTVEARASTPPISFARGVDLADAGFRVRVMNDAMPDAVPPPAVRLYRRTDDETAPLQKRYNPVELWGLSQHAGSWVDPRGSRLTFAVADTMPPRDRGQKVSLDHYRDLVTELTRPNPWSVALLETWLQTYLALSRPMKLEAVPNRLRNLNAVYRPVPGPGASKAIIRLVRPARRLSSGSDPWLLVVLEPAAETDGAAAEKAMDRQLLPAIEVLRGSAGRQAIVNRAGSAAIVDAADVHSARALALDSLRSTPGWWSEETANTIALSNLSPRFRASVLQIQRELEALRPSFVAAFPPIRDETMTAVLRFPATREQYLSYVPPESAWTSGVWIPSREELVISPLDEGALRNRREHLQRVAYHEAFHQYAFYATNGREMPVWLNEGIASFFEGAVVSGASVRIEEVEGYVAHLLALIQGDALNLNRLLRLSHSEFYDTDPARRQTNYVTAWGLVYYLLKGAPALRKDAYTGIIPAVRVGLTTTTTPMDATRSAISDALLAELERDFKAFWTSSASRRRARMYRLTR